MAEPAPTPTRESLMYKMCKIYSYHELASSLDSDDDKKKSKHDVVKPKVEDDKPSTHDSVTVKSKVFRLFGREKPVHKVLGSSCFKVLLPEEVVVDRVGRAQIEQNQMEPYPSMMSSKQELDPFTTGWKKSVATGWKKSVAAGWIQRELEEMQSNPSDDFKCLALKSNPNDWQFAIRGPNGTEFEGGIYHGRIQFSEECPDKPPIFTLLTENGRFKTQIELSFFDTKIDIYSVRDALLRLIELLPTYPNGALGSVEYDKEERRALAIKSREAAPRYGTAERQKLIDEIHEYMLSKVPLNDRDRRKQDMVTKKRKRKQDINLIFGNTINADNCTRVGFFDFGKRLKSLCW